MKKENKYKNYNKRSKKRKNKNKYIIYSNKKLEKFQAKRLGVKRI